ncbi:T9SS type A sorting domain-containing protein [Aquimarina sp. TRL1]|uniref:M43 family zinc metalloprotease n=1 Tax=Aquimarina sp. (strain TRL1) TaxID=2736252 RepID=UPI00158E29F8|nr:M43 family zinc metalloprotease [Aquimarina sp. TRL1]QKX04339.1 T9SS type A sorting domain-containing protein [Aquimarina sp. TRL1]
MKIRIAVLTILVLYIPIICLGQQTSVDARKCKSSEVNAVAFSQNPTAQSEYDAFNKKTKGLVQEGIGLQKRGMTYTIPVVVHVYGKIQHGKTVDYNTIHGALEALNKDFNGLNDDFNSIDPVFDGRKSTLNIRFALAKIDPNGGSTNGVIIHPEASGMGNYGSPIVAADGWDNYKYMNVYITGDLYGDGASNNSGVAWYPNTSMSDQNIARVVYNGQYLHGNTNKEFASVFTHEFGHWLNLIHTFEGGCNDPNGDYVSDTPTEDSNSGDKGCTIGASECGNLINYENYMGYDSASGCAKMFTIGQVNRMLAALEHPSRRPLWQPANLIATGVDLKGASLVASNNTVEEAVSNNGSLAEVYYDIEIQGGSFSLSSGALVEGTHFSSIAPQGITTSISVITNQKLRVRYSGKASKHTSLDNLKGNITLKDAIISGGVSILNSAKVSFDFMFYDPFEVVYVDNPDYTANASTTWTYFVLQGAETNNYGTFFENNALKLETYTKALICLPGSLYPEPLVSGAMIDSKNNWVNGGAYPDLHVIRNANYTQWDGKTAYIGFQFELYSGKTNYGWFRVRVNADGTSYTLLDYAYSTEPFGGIKAGSKVRDVATPSCNDGIQNGDETGIDCGGSCSPCSTTPYCIAGNQGTNYISNVTFGEINNTSGNSTYSDFTAIATTIVQGEAERLTVTPYYSTPNWGANVVGGWIDWNQDGDFTDPGEEVLMKPRGAGIGLAEVIVPTTAKLGKTRLRIRYHWWDAPTPCNTTGGDEAEDYSVIVVEASTATCTDGIQNGDETGIDCGGLYCEPCNTTGNIVFVDINDIVVNTTSNWEFFRIEIGDNRDYGAWVSGGELSLVTYNKDIVCETGTNYVSFLGEGIDIGKASNFTPENHSYTISSSSYDTWKGKSGYVGFTFSINGEVHYGWFYLTVAIDGLSYTIKEYAYNSIAGAPIRTGRNYTAINESCGLEMHAYPNPYTKYATIDLSKLQKAPVEICVYDMYGKQINRQFYKASPTKFVLGEKTKTSGYYIVKIHSKSRSEVFMIVKK